MAVDAQILFEQSKCYLCLGISQAEALQLALLSQVVDRLSQGPQVLQEVGNGTGSTITGTQSPLTFSASGPLEITFGPAGQRWLIFYSVGAHFVNYTRPEWMETSIVAVINGASASGVDFYQGTMSPGDPGSEDPAPWMKSFIYTTQIANEVLSLWINLADDLIPPEEIRLNSVVTYIIAVRIST